MHLDGAAVRGNERQAVLVARGLRRRGHEVVVACRPGSETHAYVEANGLAASGVRPRGDVDLFSLLRFALWLRRLRPDALLLTSWKRAFTAGLAGRLAGVPRIVQRLGGPHPVRPGPRGWKQRLALTRWPHRIVVNSHGLGDQVAGELPGLPADRIAVVESAIEPTAAEPADLRGETSLPADAVTVLAVGGLEPLKGYEDLIEALAQVDARVHVIIAGGGTSDRRSALESAARAAGVAGRVHLLGHRDDVPSLLAAADAFVHASLIDSLPNAVMEAMAAELPVVSTDVPGVTEALSPRDGAPAAGWVVPRGDAAALAAALDEVAAGVVAGSADVGSRAAEAARRMRQVYTMDRMIDGYEDALGGGP